jgi:hypothetical protein
MKYLTLAIIFLILLSCEKESSDYRDKYTGNYNFKIIKIFYLTGNSSADTSFYNGFIEKKEKNQDRIIIHFGISRWAGTGGANDTFVGTDYPDPKVNIDGTLSYPEWGRQGNVFFDGSFISPDSINLILSVGGGAGGTCKKVYGHRIK